MSNATMLETSRITSSSLAYHRNFAAFYQMIASERGLAAEYDGVAVAATDFPISWLNLAVILRAPNDPERALAWAASVFTERSVPWLLYAADAEAAAIAPAAARLGLVSDHIEPGMARSPIPMNPTCPEALTILRVETPELLAAYQAIFAEAYEVPLSLSEQAFSTPVATAPGHTMYVGFVDDRPVTITNRVTTHRIAGIYAVGTIPAYRRRGLAAAMVLRAAADGYTEGCLASYLQSWEMGVGVYSGIGFRPVITYTCWHEPS
jgi:hypothetical protein